MDLIMARTADHKTEAVAFRLPVTDVARVHLLRQHLQARSVEPVSLADTHRKIVREYLDAHEWLQEGVEPPVPLIAA